MSLLEKLEIALWQTAICLYWYVLIVAVFVAVRKYMTERALVLPGARYFPK